MAQVFPFRRGGSWSMATPARIHKRSLSGNIIGQQPSQVITPACSNPNSPQPALAEVLQTSQPPKDSSGETRRQKRRKGPRDRRILVLGLPGSGKSTVGNAIMGKQLLPVPSCCPRSGYEVDNSFLVKTRKVGGRIVTVVDTQDMPDIPGLNNKARAWLSQCSPGPHAFVLVMDLYAYHQQQHQDADRAHWVAEGDAKAGTGPQSVELETQVEWQTTEGERGPDRDVESCTIEKEKAEDEMERAAGGRPVEEQNKQQSRKAGLFSVQRYFGEEALKYTVLVFTHGDLLSHERRNDLLREDLHLKRLIQALGDEQHILSSKSWRKKRKTSKLMNIIDQMLIRNGGQHYAPQSHVKVENEVSLAKSLHMPFSVPPALATLDLSPAGIVRLQKILKRMAMGALTGAITGSVFGVSLNMATFILDRLGPSMIGYVALLVMPLLLGGSSDSGGAFSFSSLSGGVIGGFFLIMTLVGAVFGSVRGGEAAAGAETFKEAALMGAQEVCKREKAAFFKSYKAAVQRLCGESAPPESGALTEEAEGEAVEAKTEESSENRTVGKKPPAEGSVEVQSQEEGVNGGAPPTSPTAGPQLHDSRLISTGNNLDRIAESKPSPRIVALQSIEPTEARISSPESSPCENNNQEPEPTQVDHNKPQEGDPKVYMHTHPEEAPPTVPSNRVGQSHTLKIHPEITLV